MTSDSKYFNGDKWPWKLEQSEMGDHFVLRDADGRYVSDALIEGTAQQFFDIASGLMSRRSVSHKRCAASLHPTGDYYEFCSPRNTLGGYARLDVEFADELAEHIEFVIEDAQDAAEDDEEFFVEHTPANNESTESD